MGINGNGNSKCALLYSNLWFELRADMEDSAPPSTPPPPPLFPFPDRGGGWAPSKFWEVVRLGVAEYNVSSGTVLCHSCLITILDSIGDSAYTYRTTSPHANKLVLCDLCSYWHHRDWCCFLFSLLLSLSLCSVILGRSSAANSIALYTLQAPFP